MTIPPEAQAQIHELSIGATQVDFELGQTNRGIISLFPFFDLNHLQGLPGTW
jgi:hypothetical protein